MWWSEAERDPPEAARPAIRQVSKPALRRVVHALIRPESSLQKGLALLPSPPFFTQTWNNLFPDNAGSVTMSPS